VVPIKVARWYYRDLPCEIFESVRVYLLRMGKYERPKAKPYQVRQVRVAIMKLQEGESD